jgi:myxalamid-type polyketide synthase MxaE and MxaD
MRLASTDAQRGFKDAGLEPMPAAQATDALGRLLGTRTAQAVVARVDWSVLKPLHEARRRRPFLAQMATSAPSRADARAGSEATLAAKLATVPTGQRREVLVDFVRHAAAAVLGTDSAESVPLETGLFELGMDSLMSVELKRRLEQGAARTLPSTLTFNYPNVAALAAFLDAEIGAIAQPSAKANPTSAPTSRVQTRTAVSHAKLDVDALSDTELEARLIAALERHLT